MLSSYRQCGELQSPSAADPPRLTIFQTPPWLRPSASNCWPSCGSSQRRTGRRVVNWWPSSIATSRRSGGFRSGKHAVRPRLKCSRPSSAQANGELKRTDPRTACGIFLALVVGQDEIWKTEPGVADVVGWTAAVTPEEVVDIFLHGVW